MHFLIESLIAITLSALLQASFLENSSKILKQFSNNEFGQLADLDYPAPNSRHLQFCRLHRSTEVGSYHCDYEIHGYQFEWVVFHAFAAE